MKTYKIDDFNVTWEPDVCIHSRKCFTQLIRVFDPRKKPWINLSGASIEEIKKAIDHCPSKALKYFENNNSSTENVESIPQFEDKSTIKLLKDGPVEYQGECVIIDDEGNESYKSGKFFLCRCGASNNKPFCDGSHRKIGFKS